MQLSTSNTHEIWIIIIGKLTSPNVESQNKLEKLPSLSLARHLSQTWGRPVKHRTKALPLHAWGWSF